jgi:quercetin dioxygenase-like cupin family protein
MRTLTIDAGQARDGTGGLLRICALTLAMCASLAALARAQAATATPDARVAQTDGKVKTSADRPQSGIKRTDLQRNDLSVPGRELIQARVDIAPGVMFPRHSHPGEEIVYVIEGSLEYQLDGRPPVTLNAGDVLFIPAGAIHAVKNLGTGNGAELATYIVEEGKPLLVLAQ